MRKRLATHWITHCWRAARRITERDPRRGRAICAALTGIELRIRRQPHQQRAREGRR